MTSTRRGWMSAEDLRIVMTQSFIVRPCRRSCRFALADRAWDAARPLRRVIRLRLQAPSSNPAEFAKQETLPTVELTCGRSIPRPPCSGECVLAQPGFLPDEHDGFFLATDRCPAPWCGHGRFKNVETAPGALVGCGSVCMDENGFPRPRIACEGRVHEEILCPQAEIGLLDMETC